MFLELLFDSSLFLRDFCSCEAVLVECLLFSLSIALLIMYQITLFVADKKAELPANTSLPAQGKMQNQHFAIVRFPTSVYILRRIS